MRVLSGNIEAANIRNAIINTATINQATINTANITNATINIGYFTGNATANFSMVTKQYVDNAIANISGGSGPDLTANIFLLKGDLLVGFAPNTAHRLGVGTNGQVLTVFGSSNLKQQWTDVTVGSQAVINLDIGTHYHPTLKSSQVLLRHADGIVMNDGELVAGWGNLVANIAVTGAGGLDSVSIEAANTWYEVWAIRNSSSDTRALLLHRMISREVDQSWDGQPTTFAFLGYGADDLTSIFQRRLSRVSQSIVANATGPLRVIQIRITPGSTPTDIRTSQGNVWITLEEPDGTGNATGSVLATSRTFTTRDMGSGTCDLHFIFDTAATVISGEKYIFSIRQDWTINIGFASSIHANVFGMTIHGNTATLGPGQQAWMANVGYNGGGTYFPYSNIGFGDCRGFNVQTGAWSTMANLAGPTDLRFKTFIEHNETALVLPSGYNQKALLSFVCNDGSSNFKEYHQKDRTLGLGFNSSWEVDLHDSTLPGLTQGMLYRNLSFVVPPIPCTVQFLGRPISGTFLSFGIKLATIQGLDITLSPLNNFRHGMYTHGPSGMPMGLINMMPLEGLQAILSYDSSVGINSGFVYPMTITF
jgi:hypothetical protein